MGGRLDATNPRPDDAVVVFTLTSVDFNHQGFLRSTMHKLIWRVSEMKNIENSLPHGVAEVSRDEICDLSNKVEPLPRFLLLF